ncbi:MAG: hypothetical protein GY719_23670 [bacterium]|nr:hypothetical protein [bacterium]
MADVHPIYLDPAGTGPFTSLNRIRPTDRLLTVVNEADFSAAFSMMVANTVGNPTALVLPVSTMVGRLATGDVIAMTGAQARALLNVADGAQALAGTQLGAGAHVWRDVQSAAMRFRSLVNATPTLLQIVENDDDITLSVLPAGVTLVGLGDTSGSPSNGDVPEWDGAAFQFVPNGSGGGIGDVVDDPTPQLGGDLDVNANSIVSAGANDVTIAPVAGRDIALNTSGGGEVRINGDPALPVDTGTPALGDIIQYDGAQYAKLAMGFAGRRLVVTASGLAWGTDTRYKERLLNGAEIAIDDHGLGYIFQNSDAVRAVYYVKGTAPSVTFSLQGSPQRNGTPTEVLSSKVATQEAGFITNQGLTVPITAGTYIWAEITAVSGTVDEFYFAIVFNESQL